ncbi:MAG TPA: hypothetical protein VME66_06970 [Candidatus Acidoferrales bacterium]|nr:hypothetical protein [Candidatus Acidoferrales bacterium]
MNADRLRPSLAVAFVTMLLVVASASIAQARTYSHSTSVFFGNLTLGPDDEVDGDLNVIFGSATCDGAVIHGDVSTIGGTFTELDGCQVDGEVVNLLQGDSVQAYVPWLPSVSTPRDFFNENARLWYHLAYGVIVLVVFLLFPVRVRVALERVERHPGLSAAVGALAMVAVAPLALLLVISVIGIPLVVLEAAALLAGIWIGQAAVAILVGRRLFELVRPYATPSPLAALVLGLVIVSAAEIVPVAGWAVTATVWLVGLGAAILAFVRESTFGPFISTRPGPGPQPPVGGPPMKTA